MTEQEKIEMERSIKKRFSVIGSKAQEGASSTQRDNVTYWEKTVEWVFARKYFKPNLFLAPLSSAAEAAGDTMVRIGDEDSWLLIEFKRTKADFKAEQSKYPIFAKTKKWDGVSAGKIEKANSAFGQLIDAWRVIKRLDRCPPHILVYGHIELEGTDTQRNASATLDGKDSLKFGWHTLSVAGQSYWGEWCNHQSTSLDVPDGTPVDLDKLSSLGWELLEFKGYVSTLLLAKCADDDMLNGSSWGYDTVMAVAQDGTTKTLSMAEFAQRHRLIEASTNGPSQKLVLPDKKPRP